MWDCLLPVSSAAVDRETICCHFWMRQCWWAELRMALLCSSVIADQGTLSDSHELLLLLAAVFFWVECDNCNLLCI